ncbi:hypothetical protein GcM1_233055 [Golovinomyces cichoracearum]|uniref:Uncharacterized protein n=1 Tax=Golovinomyces cichoracearum TaxID=62708 RepID=A0A420ILZ1_9PEZI|nr:hypothetical protein GcM1_233055 [Golovinomyces cichoracearum]
MINNLSLRFIIESCRCSINSRLSDSHIYDEIFLNVTSELALNNISVAFCRREILEPTYNKKNASDKITNGLMEESRGLGHLSI